MDGSRGARSQRHRQWPPCSWPPKRVPTRPALAESLPPSVGKLLDRVGVRSAVDAAGFVRATGNTVWWGTADARVESFGAGSLGWQVRRDTFDTAVCEQAGGVDGRAEVEIEGRRTYVGTCAGGVRTYHVHLPDSDVIVSMQSVGEGRYGERVVAGLAE